MIRVFFEYSIVRKFFVVLDMFITLFLWMSVPTFSLYWAITTPNFAILRAFWVAMAFIASVIWLGLCARNLKFDVSLDDKMEAYSKRRQQGGNITGEWNDE